MYIYKFLAGESYSPDVLDQLSQNIQFCQNRIKEIRLSLHISADVSKYFSPTLNKTLLAQIQLRPLLKITKEEGLEKLENLLNQVQFITEMSRYQDFHKIIEMLDLYHAQPKNIFTKAFLDNTIFKLISAKRVALFGLHNLTDIIMHEF